MKFFLMHNRFCQCPLFHGEDTLIWKHSMEQIPSWRRSLNGDLEDTLMVISLPIKYVYYYRMEHFIDMESFSEDGDWMAIWSLNVPSMNEVFIFIFMETRF